MRHKIACASVNVVFFVSPCLSARVSLSCFCLYVVIMFGGFCICRICLFVNILFVSLLTYYFILFVEYLVEKKYIRACFLIFIFYPFMGCFIIYPIHIFSAFTILISILQVDLR